MDRSSTRREWLRQATGFTFGLMSTAANVVPAESRFDEIPTSGSTRRGLRPFDDLMLSFMKQHAVPGAALAVMRNGRLEYSRGFGWADLDAKEPVQPKSLFRIASVSKPITAAAVMKLVEGGKLKLDEPVLPHLLRIPGMKSPADSRFARITVRHCLQHTAGWDRDESGDPIGKMQEIASTLSRELPIRPTDLVQFVMTLPLDFTPGERFAYSNVGFLVLSRLIEHRSGEAYESFVKRTVFEPLGIRTAQLGFAARRRRVKDEVTYVDRQNRSGPGFCETVIGQTVPLQYGVANFDAYEAHGGWIACAEDLVRFAAAHDPDAKKRILNPATVEELWRRPAGRAGTEESGQPRAAYYGLGWNVRPTGTGEGQNSWHTGYIVGSEAMLIRRSDGIHIAVVFNTNDTPDGKPLAGAFDGQIHQAVAAAEF